MTHEIAREIEKDCWGEETTQQQVPHERVVSCAHCDDGEGGCVYPYYGVAPHDHPTKDGRISGPLYLHPKQSYPDNFCEDPEAPGCGTYTHR